MIDEALMLSFPSFPSTIPFLIEEITSSSATSKLNDKTRSKIRLPQLEQKHNWVDYILQRLKVVH